MVPLPLHLDCGDIEIEAGQCMAQRFALCSDQEPLDLLCKRVAILHRLMRCATLLQEILEVIHGVGLTGQEVTVLQCLPRGSPLA